MLKPRAYRAFPSLVMIVISLFVFSKANAGPARAQWLSSQQLLIKLPQGLRVADNMQFQLANSEVTFAKSPKTYVLPLLQKQDNFALVSTATLGRATIEELIHRPLKIFVTNEKGQLLDSTAIQYAGLLDELYAYLGNDLGMTTRNGQFQLKLWAPTAFNVRLALYSSPTANEITPDKIFPMTLQNGVWMAEVPRQYQNYFYLYEVTVFQPLTDRLETSIVTDPYSLSLSTNGTKSQLVDTDSAETKPYGWDYLNKPVLNSFK
ncbi:MAG: hypothetical protein J7501_16855, partial [Bdellovibrio sp.]|nr:hypothetical protein [Bdellovibrio sp.]